MTEPTLQVVLDDLATHGCTDGYCHLRGPATGMHTNGGCKCLEGIRNPTVRSRIMVVLRLARAALRERETP
jgi:hypothetical protein